MVPQMPEEEKIAQKAQEIIRFLDDRYEFDSILGQGGMGLVFKARHRLLNKMMAIKTMIYPSSLDYDLQRFQQEARAASKLSHSNIVAIHDFGVTPDSAAYLIMDFVNGLNLEQVLDECSRFNQDRFFKIFFQICAALDHAHKHGVIHRDVKESNVMITQTADAHDLVKVVDFGLAKILTPDKGQTLTVEGTIMGSPLFMAPEICKGLKADARCDIYSLGCLMYRCLSGEYPFVGTSAFDTMALHIHRTPKSFAVIDSSLKIPAALEELILKAMEKEPEKRQQSMVELIDGLNAIRAAAGASAGEPEGVAAAKAGTGGPGSTESGSGSGSTTAETLLGSAQGARVNSLLTQNSFLGSIAAIALIVVASLSVVIISATQQTRPAKNTDPNSTSTFSKPDSNNAVPGTSRQLIKDGGFEGQADRQISAPWFCEGKGLFGIDSDGTNSHHGQKNAWMRASQSWCAIKQKVAVAPQTAYELSCFLRDSGNFSDGRLGVRDGQSQLLAETPFSKLRNYTRVSLQFNSGPNSEIEVFAGFNASGHDAWLQLDGFSLKPVR